MSVGKFWINIGWFLKFWFQGFESCCCWLIGLERGQMVCDFMSTAAVDPALNGYQEKSWEENTGSLKWFAPKYALHCRPKALNQEIGTCTTQTIGQHAKTFYFNKRVCYVFWASFSFLSFSWEVLKFIIRGGGCKFPLLFFYLYEMCISRNSTGNGYWGDFSPNAIV